MPQSSLVDKAINTIRFLAADAIQKANSGHPGLPMGAAALTYALWAEHLKFDPQSPTWPDRDRFVISAGHGSMLLYALLHLTGYDLPMEELKRFRQLESRTPGHPEYNHTPGVETTTGPLGQGFGNGVGMAIAAERMAAMYNRDGFPIVDHTIYALVSDGDLMEGLSHEAASLAGHLRLGRLVYLYDDNRITIDGSTDLTYTEDRAARFRAYDWHVLGIEDASSTEFQADGPHPVISELPEQKKIEGLGGTMRLGAQDVQIMPGTLAHMLFGGKPLVRERFRHRYEVDPARVRPPEPRYLVGDYSRFTGATNRRPEIPFAELLDDILNYWREYLRTRMY